MKEKIKIMRVPPQITDEEIRSLMDFNAVLRQRDEQILRHRKARYIRTAFIGLACLLVVPALMLLRDQRQDQADRKEQMASAVLPSTSPGNDSAPADSSHGNLQKEDPEPVKTQSDEVERPDRKEVTRPRAESQTPKHPGSGKTIPVYVQAAPLEGYPLLYDYFDKNLVYPTEAVKDSLEGTLNVVFVIDPSGDARDITIENSLGILLDREAIRLVENMPLWAPATYNGVPVKSRISLPLTFSLHKNRK